MCDKSQPHLSATVADRALQDLKLFLWMGKLFPTRDQVLRRSPQILIEGGPADAELARQGGFRLAGFNTTQ